MASKKNERMQVLEDYRRAVNKWHDERQKLVDTGELDVAAMQALTARRDELRDEYTERMRGTGYLTDSQARVNLMHAEKDVERSRKARKVREEKMARMKETARATFVRGGGTEDEFEELWPELERQEKLRELTEAREQAESLIEFPRL